MLCALFTHHGHLRHYHIVESPATCHLPCCQNSVCLWHTGIGVQMQLADPCQIIKTQHKTFCYCINRKWLRPRKRKSIFFFFLQKKNNRKGKEEITGEGAEEHIGVRLCGLRCYTLILSGPWGPGFPC